MKVATIDELKKELSHMPPKKVLDLTLRLARFKKENKELLTYLLFDSADEPGYIHSLQIETEELLANINDTRTSAVKKQLRRISRMLGRQMKYIGSKNASVELILHFAESIHSSGYASQANIIYEQQLNKVRKLISFVEEDLQHDFRKRLSALEVNVVKKKWWKS